jgi:hypothetical protein
MHEVDKDVVDHIKKKTQVENEKRPGMKSKSKRYISLDKKLVNTRSRLKTAFQGYGNMRAIKLDKGK